VADLRDNAEYGSLQLDTISAPVIGGGRNPQGVWDVGHPVWSVAQEETLDNGTQSFILSLRRCAALVT